MGGPGGEAFHLVKRFAYNTVKMLNINILVNDVSFVQCTFTEQVLWAKLTITNQYEINAFLPLFTLGNI
jgi:hypothetical protein